MASRPDVTVVMPFAGTGAERELAISRLAAITTGSGDELILVDNRLGPGEQPFSSPPVRVVVAGGELSSYHARNAGAAEARSEWLLFIDADCSPPPDLLDRYFAEPLPDRCGVVAGGVVAAPGQRELTARYASSRGHIDESWHVERDPLPAGVTANLLVLRAAWESLGGFQEGIRSGGDVELCWRIQEAGWSFAHRPVARVSHHHPFRVAPMLRKTARHAAGRLWVERRYQGAYPRPRLVRPLVRSLGGALVWALRGQRERAAFKLLDGAWSGADVAGWTLGSNRAARDQQAPAGRSRGGVLLMTDAAPARSETFIASEASALEASGRSVRFEASARPARIDRSAAGAFRFDYLEDDSPSAKLAALLRLAASHPRRIAADVRSRSRRIEGPRPWPLAALAPAVARLERGGEAHVHVHFGAAAAQHGLRIARLAGVPCSVALHGYDVYQQPTDLAAKLAASTFATAACESMRSDLATVAGTPAAERIHVVPMGVDPVRFARRRAVPGSGKVVAIGRLVEKKGFAHLIDAIAELGDGPVGSLTIFGEGPLREALSARIEELGLAGRAEIRPLWGAEAVRGALEDADLMVAPSVIAADGDRDSMPVVAKEAMAMELPVIASDLVGLPELIDESVGRLVPAGDPIALAAAISELLALPPAERAALGAAGRRRVEERFTVEREARLLAELIAEYG